MVVEHLKRAWAAYKKNFWPLVGSYLLLTAITMLLAFLGIALVMIPFIGYAVDQIPTESEIALAAPLVVSGFLVFLIAVVVGTILKCGYIGLAAEALKKKTKLSTLFDTVRKRWVSLLGTEILKGIITLFLFAPALFFGLPQLQIAEDGSFAVGSWSLLCVAILLAIVAAFVSLLFVFNAYAVVLDKTTAVGGIRKSFEFVRKTYISLLALVILLAIITLGGSMLPIIGTLIALVFIGPFTILTLTSFYLSKKKRR